MFVRLFGLLGLLILLLSCSNERQINAAEVLGDGSLNKEARPEENTKIDSPVAAFGVFSNIDGNGVHESGYAVELWSYEGNLVGVLIGSAGTRLVGDPPTGILRVVMYNSDTGVISFRARIGDVDHEFNGNLAEKKLSGRLFDMSGRLQSQRCDEAVKVVLPRSQKQTNDLQEYPSYEKWKENMNETLTFRGSKETAE